MSKARHTTDHDAIRGWAKARDGRPSRVRDTSDGGILRIDFDPPEESLEEISWDEFFAVFEDRELAFLYQDKTEDGQTSRFGKFIHRSEAGDEPEGK